jgi:hypothetical protein
MEVVSWSEAYLPFSFYIFFPIGVSKWLLNDWSCGPWIQSLYVHCSCCLEISSLGCVHRHQMFNPKFEQRIVQFGLHISFFQVWFQTQQWGLQVFDLMESLTLVSIFLLGFGSNTIMGFQIFDLTFEQGNYFSFGLCLYLCFGFWFKHNGFILHHHPPPQTICFIRNVGLRWGEDS